MLKRIMELLLLNMLAVISFASCVEESGEVAPKLEVSQTEVMVEPAGGEVVITFKANRDVKVAVSEHGAVIAFFIERSLRMKEPLP